MNCSSMIKYVILYFGMCSNQYYKVTVSNYGHEFGYQNTYWEHKVNKNHVSFGHKYISSEVFQDLKKVLKKISRKG